MKRLLISLLVVLFSLLAALVTVVVALTIFFGVTAPTDPVRESLPDYISKEFYSSGGFQDFTDYGKFTYSLSEEVLEENPYLRPVTEADLEVIFGYLDNFENWVALCTDLPAGCYDFDRSLMGEGDYFYIHNTYTEPDKLYWDYTLYYFDSASGILYHFHSNI